MKQTLALALVFIAILAALGAWYSFTTASNVAMNNSPDSQQGGSVVQVIEKIMPQAPIAPEIASATWLNSKPLASQDLRGHVVVVEFWTFDCINCRNVIPTVRSWHEKYQSQGLIVVGVHSPEFAYEKETDGVKRAIKELNIPYPVALDNDFKIWNSFNVWAWPSWFILDKQGRIRFSHVGEGAYTESEEEIQQLLKEN